MFSMRVPVLTGFWPLFCCWPAPLAACGGDSQPDSAAPSGSDDEPRLVVVDTDGGSDDAMALLYLLQHSDVEVAAITVTRCGPASICPVGASNVAGVVELAAPEQRHPDRLRIGFAPRGRSGVSRRVAGSGGWPVRRHSPGRPRSRGAAGPGGCGRAAQLRDRSGRSPGHRPHARPAHKCGSGARRRSGAGRSHRPSRRDGRHVRGARATCSSTRSPQPRSPSGTSTPIRSPRSRCSGAA